MSEGIRRLFFPAITLVLVVQTLQFTPWALGAPPVPPVAIFTYTPIAPLVNETVTFDGSNSTGDIVRYQWIFDEIGFADEENPIAVFDFPEPRIYNVTLKVIDSGGSWNTTSQNVTAYAPPFAIFNYSVRELLIDEIVTFNASNSYDLDGSIESYSWDFADGTNGTGVSVDHIYLVEGNYTVVLNATDNDGFANSTFKSMTITTRHPLASFAYSPAFPIVDQAITLNASFSEPRGGTIDSYVWNFGDGTIVAENISTTTHVYNATGTFTVTLNVTDSEGLWDTESKNLTLTGLPVASFTCSPVSAIVNERVTFNASLSVPNGGTLLSYFWEFGDGTNTTENNPIAYHTYTTAGTFMITLNVTDSEGHWDLDSKSIEAHIHDVAVIEVMPSATEVYIGQVVNITVVVRNEGTDTETFEVTLQLNETLIETQTVTDLAPNEEKTLKFSWIATGVPPDASYVFKAEAATVIGETAKTNNAHINGVVKVRSQPTLLPFGLNTILPYLLIICLGSGLFAASGLIWKSKMAKRETVQSGEQPPTLESSNREEEVKEYRDYILLLLEYQKVQDKYKRRQISREEYLRLKTEYEEKLAQKGAK